MRAVAPAPCTGTQRRGRDALTSTSSDVAGGVRLRLGLGLLLALALLLLLPGLGSAPLERAEIYFMDGARSLIEHADFLVPRYRGEPFFDKPILTYWLMALAFLGLGFEPGAARLVPAAATLAAVAATVWLGRRLFDVRSALVGGFVLVTTLAFVGFGRVGMSDMLLTAWVVVSVTLMVEADRGPARWWTVPALGASLGLGFLTKGPVGVLLPGLAVPWLAWRRRSLRLPASWPRLALGTLAFVVCGLGWFVALAWRLGSGPLEYFFLHENLQRFAGEAYDAGQGPWYYFAVYLGEGLPWSALLPLAVWRELREPAPGRDGARFLAAWLALMAVPLSLSRGKIDYYLLPLYPAASLLVARLFVARPWGRRERAWAASLLAALAAVLLVLAALPAPLPDAWLPGRAARMVLRAWLAASGLALVATAWRPRPRRVAVVLGASTAGLFAWLAGAFLPAFRAGQPNDAIAADVARELRYRPEAELVLCEDPSRAQRDVLFRARAAAVERCDLWAFAGADRPYLFLLDPRERLALSELPYWREVATYRAVAARALSLRYLLRVPAPEELSLMANFETDDPVALRKYRKARKRALQAVDAPRKRRKHRKHAEREQGP